MTKFFCYPFSSGELVLREGSPREMRKSIDMAHFSRAPLVSTDSLAKLRNIPSLTFSMKFSFLTLNLYSIFTGQRF
jgi:hypothetical protein